MSLYTLQQKIYENKLDRNFNVSDVGKEIILLTEELGELCDALIENNQDEIVDALGDIMVYGLGLSAMFGLDADEIINNVETSDYRYIGRAIGRIAKNYKRSNKQPVGDLDRKDEFKQYIGDLLGYCAKALGDDYISALESIIDNNTTRTHSGQI